MSGGVVLKHFCAALWQVEVAETWVIGLAVLLPELTAHRYVADRCFATEPAS